jgi:hypothetical protein
LGILTVDTSSHATFMDDTRGRLYVVGLHHSAASASA